MGCSWGSQAYYMADEVAAAVEAEAGGVPSSAVKIEIPA